MVKILTATITLGCFTLLGTASCTAAEPPIPNKSTITKQSIVSTYIRSNFYELANRITDCSIVSNNDLIHMVASPRSDGSLFFEIPDNDAALSNVSYLSTFKGRTGVGYFGGAGASMSAQYGLLDGNPSTNGDGSVSQFTFGTWLYMDSWVAGAHLFAKEGDASKVECTFGSNPGDLIFVLGHYKFIINASQLTVGKWHHLSLAFDGNGSLAHRVAVYIDGEMVSGDSQVSDFPARISCIKAPFMVGVGFNGKLDNTFVHSLALGKDAIARFMNQGISLRNTDWNSTKTLAYWNYDNKDNVGLDSQSWKSIYSDIRKTVGDRSIKVRMGIMAGDWKRMISSSESRSTFISSIYRQLVSFGWDGVDLDFEWIYNNEDFSSYNQLIIELCKKLKPLNKTVSVSLHPISYKISKAAIDALDFISLQVYGPSPYIFKIDTFNESLKNVLSYGIPREKLVVGVPFYGAESNGQKGTIAYCSLVNAGAISTPDFDEATLDGKKYILNGQRTIREKVKIINENRLAGVMSWDLATDVPVENGWSLLRIVTSEVK